VPLPSPYEYDDWRDYASALVSVLEGGLADVAGVGSVDGSQITGTVPAGNLPGPPSNALPVYWSLDNQELFLAPDFYVPPVPIPPFQIDTQSLALASVELQTIADDAVSTAKIIDLAVLNAKIANATILSAKIGDLQVLSAKIADLAVTNAKINNLAVDTAQINNLAVTTAKVGAAQIGTAQIANAAITNALIANLAVGTANIIDANITSAKIGAAEVLTANIGLAQITAALIATLAVGTAAIQDAAVTNAKIGDAEIQSAKIASLIVDKITAGTLDAVIDVGTGLLRFTIAGNTLSIGKGFGTTNQFIMWFGPSMAEAAMTEDAAVFYLRVDGSAYFGGTLSAGTITNSGTTTALNALSFTLGPFTSGGNPVQITGTGYTERSFGTGGNTWNENMPEQPDPFINSRKTLEVTYVVERSTDGSNFTVVQTYGPQQFVSQSRAVVVGQVIVNGDPVNVLQWEHFAAFTATLQSSHTFGATNTAYARYRRTEYHNVTDNVDYTQPNVKNRVQVITVEQ